MAYFIQRFSSARLTPRFSRGGSRNRTDELASRTTAFVSETAAVHRVIETTDAVINKAIVTTNGKIGT
jgi:hypothetical protein